MSGWEDPRYVQSKYEDLSRRVDAALSLLAHQKGPLPGWIRGGVIEAGRIISPQIEINAGGGTQAVLTLTTVPGVGGVPLPVIVVQPNSYELLVTPQLAIEDVRDSPAAPFVIINDQQTALDAGLTARTYSEISVASGSTLPVDQFVTVSQPGGLGPGAFISRRVGLLWGGAGNWGVDASFPFRYHATPSSVTLTPVTGDSLNGGTKSVNIMDYLGFTLQIVGAAGGGFTLNRWTASGGS